MSSEVSSDDNYFSIKGVGSITSPNFPVPASDKKGKQCHIHCIQVSTQLLPLTPPDESWY